MVDGNICECAGMHRMLAYSFHALIVSVVWGLCHMQRCMMVVLLQVDLDRHQTGGQPIVVPALGGLFETRCRQ
jgi:hypothetical protein